MSWQITLSETAEKQLSKLDRQIAQQILITVVRLGNRRDVYR
jgi:mRNA-degrading endonuclease RelE of RelBE toxin-antitoxin system